MVKGCEDETRPNRIPRCKCQRVNSTVDRECELDSSHSFVSSVDISQCMSSLVAESQCCRCSWCGGALLVYWQITSRHVMHSVSADVPRVMRCQCVRHQHGHTRPLPPSGQLPSRDRAKQDRVGAVCHLHCRAD